METDICPVVKAIQDIRGGNIFDDESDNDLIKLGGNENCQEIVYDDSLYYLMSRKIELARFELTRPNLDQCRNKFGKMFENIRGKTYRQIYNDFISQVSNKIYLYDQFANLIRLILNMEKLVAEKIIQLSRQKNINMNVSLSSIHMSPDMNIIILYNPDILCNVTNIIIDYINKLNINNLLVDPLIIKVSYIDKCTAQLDMNKKITIPEAYTAVDYLNKIKNVLNQELEVINYIKDVEKYQCMAINHINQVYDICKKIIIQLT